MSWVLIEGGDAPGKLYGCYSTRDLLLTGYLLLPLFQFGSLGLHSLQHMYLVHM